MAKVERDSGPNGGDRLLVKAGGTIKLYGLGTGGAKIEASGGQAAHISNPTMITVTAGNVLASKFNGNFATLDAKIESILTALRNIGVLATS